MRIHLRAGLILPVLGVVLFAAMASAQDASPANTDTGVIFGVVTDASTQRLPGVTVSIKTATSARSAVTDAQGRYRIAGLALGLHRVVVELPGFRRTAKDIELTARYPEADASFLMRVGQPEERFMMPGPAPRFRVVPLGRVSR